MECSALGLINTASLYLLYPALMINFRQISIKVFVSWHSRPQWKKTRKKVVLLEENQKGCWGVFSSTAKTVLQRIPASTARVWAAKSRFLQT